MDEFPGTGLIKEVRESFFLLGICASMLAGYLGLALVMFRVAG